jgi:acetoacetate decarboxylase
MMKLTKTALAILVVSVLPNLSFGQPFQYKNSECYSVTFQTSQAVVDKLVPEPLIANQEGIMVMDIYIQRMDLGVEYVYNEMVLSIPVQYHGQKSMFDKLLYLNKVLPIISGRERWGFPKHYADIDIKTNHDTITASISQNGTSLIHLRAELGKEIESPPLIKRQLFYVHKMIPAIEKGTMDVNKLNAAYADSIRIYNVQELNDVNLKLNTIPDGQVGKIPIMKIIASEYFHSDFVLGFGETAVDYLQK